MRYVYLYRPGTLKAVAFSSAEKLAAHLKKYVSHYRCYDGYGTLIHNKDVDELAAHLKRRKYTEFYFGDHHRIHAYRYPIY